MRFLSATGERLLAARQCPMGCVDKNRSTSRRQQQQLYSHTSFGNLWRRLRDSDSLRMHCRRGRDDGLAAASSVSLLSTRELLDFSSLTAKPKEKKFPPRHVCRAGQNARAVCGTMLHNWLLCAFRLANGRNTVSHCLYSEWESATALLTIAHSR